MNTRTNKSMVPRAVIYEMLTKEDQYAQGWGAGKKATDTVFPDHVVSRKTGQPFTEIEWLDFAEEYIRQAHLVHANYCPDSRAMRIRLLKAASLLVTALQVHCEPNDIDDIAGVSSSTYPPVLGGLKTFTDKGGVQGT